MTIDRKGLIGKRAFGSLERKRAKGSGNGKTHNMRAFLSALAVSAGLMTSGASAADSVLVELFTSQGCSSCPPADEVLGQLAQREDVIALSLHVDYWDYLGWKDEFADPAHTKRQQGYAHAARENMVYTPQMVVAGRKSVVGTRTMELMDYIAEQKASAKIVDIKVARDGDEIMIAASAQRPIAGALAVQLVRFNPKQSVDIMRGENAGRTVTYHNVVTSWAVLGTWDGASDLQMSAPLSGELPAVVVIQEGTSGPVLAAARLD